MEGSITLNELGVVIIFLLIATAAGYVVITLRNFNDLIKKTNSLLQANTDHVNKIIPNINEISENTVKISREVREGIDEAGTAIKTISHGTTDTVMTINETADYLAKYAIAIGEIVKAVINSFSSSKRF